MLPVKSLNKRLLLQCTAIMTFSAQAAVAGNVGVNLNVNIGDPPSQQVVVAPAPPPVYVAPPAPVYVAPRVYQQPVETIVVEDDIEFVYPDALGFYVAVGIPYDLFYLKNSYFLYRDGRWLRAASSRGPWVVQRDRDLPRALRRHRVERIREYRTREYVVYQRDRDRYRGRHFRSSKDDWKEQRREMKERHKEERHYEKQARKDERRFEKEQRKEERRFDRDEHRDRREGRD